MVVLYKELIDWLESFSGFFSGKLGTLLRTLWYRFRWKKLANVGVRPLSQFISPKNIRFKGEASLGKAAFFTAEE